MRIFLVSILIYVLNFTPYTESNDGNRSMYLTFDDPKHWNPGPWSSLLEDWAIGPSEHRQERIIKYPSPHSYYISNRVDNTIPTAWSQEYPNSGKISSRPQQYNNYPKQKPTGFDSAPPARKEVSETDLYLLGAIEKLVYRVDFMEKRLRKAEELIYFIMSGTNKNPDPCPENFLRAGANCYQFITSKELNWKSANTACKDIGATLAEMETITENQDIVAFIQSNNQYRGKDFWTGGLNPGLLWIWSNSARPVANGEKNELQLMGNTTKIPDNPMNIKGNGRCLKLAYNPTLRSYAYSGHDCAGKQHYICEILDKNLSNDIQRISRDLKI